MSMAAWAPHGRHMDATWALHGHYMAATWALHGRYMDAIWALHGRYMGATWALYGRYMRECGYSVMTITICRQNVTKMTVYFKIQYKKIQQTNHQLTITYK